MSEKIAVVTGASSGIGWELARQLARRAYTLWLVARREERLRELSELLAREAGAGAETLALDLSDPAGRRKLAQRMESVGGALSLVVNNAGFGLVGPTAHWPFNRYEEMIRLNITALTEVSWEAVRMMTPRRSGGLINVADRKSVV